MSRTERGRDSSINHRFAVPITDCKCAAARRRRVTIKPVRQWLLCRRGGVPPIRADHYWPSAMESCHRLMHEPGPPPSAHAAHRRDVRWRTMAGHLSRGACVSALIQFAMAGISHLQRNVRIPAQQSNLPTLGRAVPMQLPRSRERRADAPSSVAAAVRKCMCTDWTPRCTCKHMGACCSGCAARRRVKRAPAASCMPRWRLGRLGRLGDDSGATRDRLGKAHIF